MSEPARQLQGGKSGAVATTPPASGAATPASAVIDTFTTGVRNVVQGASSSTGILIMIAVVSLIVLAYFQLSQFSKMAGSFSTVSKLFGSGAAATSNSASSSASSSNGSGASSSKHATLYFFYVTWCPHCKTAGPEWDALVTALEGRPINGYTVSFQKVDCTSETDAHVEDLIRTYNIEGYPTVILVKDGEVVNFDAKPTKATMTTFLNTAL